MITTTQELEAAQTNLTFLEMTLQETEKWDQDIYTARYAYHLEEEIRKLETQIREYQEKL